jgi:hypothetical protein
MHVLNVTVCTIHVDVRAHISLPDHMILTGDPADVERNCSGRTVLFEQLHLLTKSFQPVQTVQSTQ